MTGLNGARYISAQGTLLCNPDPRQATATIVTQRVALHPDGDVLGSSVLVLNQLYTAVRITNERRSLLLLFRQAAEVVNAEGGHYSTYDCPGWILLSELLQTELVHTEVAAAADTPVDWVRTPRLAIALPRVIRLLSYNGHP